MKYDINENEELEFAELERDAEFYPFADRKEYINALIKYSHPAHNKAMQIRNRRVIGMQELSDKSEEVVKSWEVRRQLEATGEY